MNSHWKRSLLLALLAGATLAATGPAGRPPARAFDWLKDLEGTWEGTFEWSGARSGSGEVRADYSLTGSDSAVVETLTSDGAVTMTSVYHRDGDDLRMTHYCAARNQPRLRAAAVDDEARRVRFELVDVTNLRAPTDGHVRRVEIEVPPGEGHLKIRFTFVGDGRESYEDVELTRIGRR